LSVNIIVIHILLFGRRLPIQSSRRSNDLVKEFLERDTSRVLKKS